MCKEYFHLFNNVSTSIRLAVNMSYMAYLTVKTNICAICVRSCTVNGRTTRAHEYREKDDNCFRSRLCDISGPLFMCASAYNLTFLHPFILLPDA